MRLITKSILFASHFSQLALPGSYVIFLHPGLEFAIGQGLERCPDMAGVNGLPALRAALWAIGADTSEVCHDLRVLRVRLGVQIVLEQHERLVDQVLLDMRCQARLRPACHGRPVGPSGLLENDYHVFVVILLLVRVDLALPPEEQAQLGLRTSAGVNAYLGCAEPFLTSWLAADLHDLSIILVHEGLPGLVVQVERDLVHIKATIRLELAVL